MTDFPMTDLEIVRFDSELEVFQVEGITDAGVEFLDAYNTNATEFHVVDSGVVIFSMDWLDNFKSEVAQGKLTLECDN